MRRALPIAVTAAALLALLPALISPPAADAKTIAGGTLTSLKGICPLKHTTVEAHVSGPLARVTVTQEFENPFAEKIEAVYTFPLPPNSAVDGMTMHIGDRTIRGAIKEREEARRIYETARRSGQVASLLKQERPNIFTQAVANLVPGARVKIEISYVETMPYESGSYEFRFPMVVAPRYMPGEPTGKQGGGWAPDTTSVPDASLISPNVTPEGTRAGHDISLALDIDAGVPIEALRSSTHDVAIERPAAARATVRLREKAVIPNKDFVVQYQVAGDRVRDAVLTHHGARGGYLTLVLQPPARPAESAIVPKELIFVLDTSGSMSGFPIEKAKEAMRAALAGLNPRDTFNLITFAGATHILFPKPVAATAANLEEARRFLDSRYGSGGTEMMRAIRAAFEPSGDEGHVRLVCFMTDGEVGNDFDIIAEVQRHPEARVFSFGIGNSVNRFLLDNLARYGRGEVEYVGLRDDGSAAARRFHERIQSPLLTDIAIDWGGLPVTEVYPQRVPDLFAARPLVVSARFSGAADGVVRLRGKLGGRDFAREIRVQLPAKEAANDVLATLWARRRVDGLMAGDFNGLQSGQMRDDLKRQIVKLGLDYRLMTQFTSFVAVEEKVITEGGEPRRVEVPVEMPDGMSYEGVFGDSDRLVAVKGVMPAMMASRAYARSVAGGVVGGVMGAQNSAIAVMQEQPSVAPPPPPPPAPPAPQASPAAQPGAAAVIGPPVRALIARVRGGGRPAVDETKFVYGGKAHLRLQLAGTSPTTLDALRRLGFEVLRQNGGTVTGRIAVEKVEALSKTAGVLQVDAV
jgi:Ca-activated chloride channel homolog